MWNGDDLLQWEESSKPAGSTCCEGEEACSEEEDCADSQAFY